MPRADAHDGLYLFCRLRENDEVRQARVVVGFAAAVMLANRTRPRHAIAEDLPQLVGERLQNHEESISVAGGGIGPPPSPLSPSAGKRTPHHGPRPLASTCAKMILVTTGAYPAGR